MITTGSLLVLVIGLCLGFVLGMGAVIMADRAEEWDDEGER